MITKASAVRRADRMDFHVSDCEPLSDIPKTNEGTGRLIVII